MGSRFAFLLAALLLLPLQAWPSVAGCVPASTISGGKRSDFAGLNAAQIESLVDVHRRIAEAARVDAELFLCPSRQINAFAIHQGGVARILVNAGLVTLAEGNRDQIAAVLGHEFGHIRMRHAEARARAAQDSIARAQREATQMVRRGVDQNTAVQQATHGFLVDFTQFSQAAEREADDAGFKFLMLAGFKAAGQRELAEKMLKAAGTRERAYFSTHPGWAERAGFSAILQKNEEFRAEAERHAEARRFRALAQVVDRWQKEIPDSGAAAFYRGIIRWMAANPAQDVSVAFEDAVAFFDGDGLSRVAQEYQPEMRGATLALCVLLYREGRKVQALHCLDRLDSTADIEKFKKLTGWGEFILVARPARSAAGSLYSGRDGDGAILLSNCGHVVEAKGLRAARPWAGARARDANAPAQAEAVACSPNLCNCEPVDMDELLDSVKRGR
jgi:Zn-dependent protease with chaperone function